MDSCDYPEFYDENKVTARKQHKCCECNNLIRRGDAYMRCVGKWDGEIRAERQHLHCYDFARKVNLDVIQDCALYFGGISEQLHDALDGMPTQWAAAWLEAEWDAICGEDFKKAKHCHNKSIHSLAKAGISIKSKHGEFYGHLSEAGA